MAGNPVGQKGYTGNPGGRPAMSKELKEAFQAATKEALQTLLEVMRKKDARDGDRVRASAEILDRGWGKAVQAIDATLTEKKPFSYDPEHSEADDQAK